MSSTTNWREKKEEALSAVDKAILSKSRAERVTRKTKRKWMARHGFTPTRAQSIYRVETVAINIPEWAEPHAIPELSREADVIWVKQRTVGMTARRGHSRVIASGRQSRKILLFM
jgi:hypothetical protein